MLNNKPMNYSIKKTSFPLHKFSYPFKFYPKKKEKRNAKMTKTQQPSTKYYFESEGRKIRTTDG